MGNVLAFCEFNGAQLRSSALVQPRVRARTPRPPHGGDVIALLVGTGAAAAGADAAKYAAKVVIVDDAGARALPRRDLRADRRAARQGARRDAWSARPRPRSARI